MKTLQSVGAMPVNITSRFVPIAGTYRRTVHRLLFHNAVRADGDTYSSVRRLKAARYDRPTDRAVASCCCCCVHAVRHVVFIRHRLQRQTEKNTSANDDATETDERRRTQENVVEYQPAATTRCHDDIKSVPRASS